MKFSNDYDGVKNFVENDSERKNKNGGTFTLLSTREQIGKQLEINKNNIKACKIILRQKNCGLHTQFRISGYDFAYRGRGCTECSKDSNSSYAHRYFQSLLTAYGIPFISEKPFDSTRLRVDFYIEPLDRYYEIDGLPHVAVTRFHSNAEERLKKYKLRDREKDKSLKRNLIRIKLYQESKNRTYITKSTGAQFKLIRKHFLKIHKEVTGIEINDADIIDKQNTECFFKNGRVQKKLNELRYLHDNHFELENAKNHVGIASSQAHTFQCTSTGKLFNRNLVTVLNPFFICPGCLAKAKQDNRVDYSVNEQIAKNLVKLLSKRHKDIEFYHPLSPFKDAIVFVTIRLKMRLTESNEIFYMPLSQLKQMTTFQIKKEIQAKTYEYKEIQKSRDSRMKKLFVKVKPIENRYEENKVSENTYKLYRTQAMKYNKNLKNGLPNKITCSEINALLPEYIHKTQQAAILGVAKYKQCIVPFFTEHKDEFILKTKLHQYAGANCPLLIKHKKCNQHFFATWFKLNDKDQSKIICQNHTCFSPYFKSKAAPPNKKTQAEILEIFKGFFYGQYFPLYPEATIRVAIPIDIVHLPTGEIVRGSVDNFKRGKFFSPYKKYTPEKIAEAFPEFPLKNATSNKSLCTEGQSGSNVLTDQCGK